MMSGHGMVLAVMRTQLCEALAKDGYNLPDDGSGTVSTDKLGPTTTAWAAEVAEALFPPEQPEAPPPSSDPALKRYRCTRSIKDASGEQEFEVIATDPGFAEMMFVQGLGELVETECEITDLGEYDLDSIWEYQL